MADWTQWHEVRVPLVTCPRTGCAYRKLVDGSEHDARDAARRHDEWHRMNDPLPPDEYDIERVGPMRYRITSGAFEGRVLRMRTLADAEFDVIESRSGDVDDPVGGPSEMTINLKTEVEG